MNDGLTDFKEFLGGFFILAGSLALTITLVFALTSQNHDVTLPYIFGGTVFLGVLLLHKPNCTSQKVQEIDESDQSSE